MSNVLKKIIIERSSNILSKNDCFNKLDFFRVMYIEQKSNLLQESSIDSNFEL